MKRMLATILLFVCLINLSSCPEKKQCFRCEGSGICDICDGDGVRSCSVAFNAMFGGPSHNNKTCTVCDDNGAMLCNACEGSGICDYCRYW